MAFRGPTLPLDRQRELFRRWSTDLDVHPHEAFVGLAALLHGATTQELQHLTDDRHRPRVAPRPARPPTPTDTPGPMDLDRAATQPRPPQDAGQQQLPHTVTAQTKSTRAAASDGYVKNTLRAVGIQPRILRSTRLVDLVGTVDAKLVATTYGMTNEAVTRLPRRPRRSHPPAEPITVQAPPRTRSPEPVRFREVLDAGAVGDQEPGHPGLS